MIATIEIRRKGNCVEKSNACSEGGKRFEIININGTDKEKLIKIKVDKCVFNDNDHGIKKCDYLFELENVFVCFVELKGKHISEAVCQIETTLCNIKTSAVKKYAFIVASKNDMPTAKTERQKYERMFKEKYQTKFDMKNAKMFKDINDLK